VDEARAIERVLAEYCQRCDDGRFDDLVDLFAADGSFAFGRREVVGREALLEYFAWAQSPDRRGKHLVSNVIIEVQGDTATARSDYVFLVRRDGDIVPLAAGRYVDDLRKADGRWRIDRRVTTNL
jgi:3-phenylpropionate/cinnamic acid dioxygenase small subunit